MIKRKLGGKELNCMKNVRMLGERDSKGQKKYLNKSSNKRKNFGRKKWSSKSKE
jgi:hypothetical protein